MMANNTNKSIYLIPVMLCFFCMGFVDRVGIASNYVKEDLGLSDSVANIFPSLVFFWFLIFSVPTGMLMNKIGRKNTVLLSLIVTVVSLLIPLFGNSFTVMLIAFATSLYFIFRTIGALTGSFFLRVMKTRWFFIISVVLMAASMILMFSGQSKMILYVAIALVGYGNSNIFSMAFSEALLSVPDKQNEVSGLMIMGLFGGTVFPLIMGFMSDAMGQAGAVAVMAVGVIYLFTYIKQVKN